MAKDYAKYVPLQKKPRNVLLDGCLILVLLLLVFGLIYIIYSHKKAHSFNNQNPAIVASSPSWAVKIKSLFTPKKSTSAKSASVAIAPPKPTEPEIRFDFYNELPAMKLALPKEIAPISKQEILTKHPRIIVNKTSEHYYFLQLGAVETKAEATQMRLSLLLSGVDATIVAGNVDHKPVYYLLYGKFIDRKQAQQVQLALQQKGVEGIISHS